MVPHSLNVAFSDTDSQVLWEDSKRVFRRGWRQDDDGRPRPVLVVTSAAVHSSRSALDRLTHEYELKDALEGTWAVRPLDLVRDAAPRTCSDLIFDKHNWVESHGSLPCCNPADFELHISQTTQARQYIHSHRRCLYAGAPILRDSCPR